MDDDFLNGESAVTTAPNHSFKVQDYRAYLRMLARTMVGPGFDARFDASDATQLAMIEALETQHSFLGRTPEEFRGWLRRILINTVLTLRRKHTAAKCDIGIEIAIATAIHRSSERLLQISDRGDPPSAGVHREEDRLALWDAIDRLPQDQREAIVLVRIGELRPAEVSAILGKTEDAVASLVYRGQRQLRKLLDEDRHG